MKNLVFLFILIFSGWVQANPFPGKNIPEETSVTSPVPFDWAQVPTLPPLDRLEAATLRRAGIQPEQISSWQKGARWSAALPQLQLGLDSEALQQNTTVIQDSISVTTSGVNIGPASNRVDYDARNNRNLEVKAVWSLDELLFNARQLDISREARDLTFVRGQLLDQLQQNYFALRSHLVQCQLDPLYASDPLARVKAESYIAKLDSLSGGEFKRLLREEAEKQNWTRPPAAASKIQSNL